MIEHLPPNKQEIAVKNLIYYFELNPEINNTLVGFNITGLTRQDIICHSTHPAKNNDLSSRDITQKLNIGWARGSDNLKIKQQGPDEIIIYNCLEIIQGIIYLESKNIDYFFMFMTSADYNAPIWIKTFLENRKKNWVTFDDQIGMLEFVKQHNLTISNDDHHPSREGHRLIASYILSHLKKNESAT
jgi:hypothetical protein